MDNVSLIIEKILKDAEEKKDEIIDKAMSESRKIEADYDDQIAEIKEQAARKNEELLYRTEKRALVAANLESRNRLLDAKQMYIDKAFENAISRIHGMSKDEKISLLVGLAKDAVVTGSEELIFDSEYLDEYGKAVVDDANKQLKSEHKEAYLSLSSETRPVGLGFIVRDEKTEVNCSLEKLILEYRDVLDSQIADILFEDIEKGDSDD